METPTQKQDEQNFVQAIDELNKRAWAEKYKDTRSSLELAKSALNEAQKHVYKKGEAYALRNIAGCHWLLAEYEEGKEEALKALRLFEDLHDSFGLAHSLNVLGNIGEKTGNHAEALDFFGKSLAIREEIGDKIGAATTLNNIGNVYFSFGRHADALDCYLRSLSFHEETNNKAGVSRSLNNIGNIYLRLGENQKAIEALNRSLVLKNEIGDRVNQGKVLLNIGDVHAAREHYEQALKFYFESLKSAQAFGDKITETTSLGNIGQIYQKLGDYKQAFEYHEKCLQTARAIGAKHGEAEALINLGSVHIKRQNFDEGIKYLEDALVLTDELRASELTQKIHRVLSEGYEAKGALGLALHHYKLFHQTFLRVFGEETEQKVKSLAVQFEIEKAQKEAEIHRLRNVELAQANDALQIANQFKTDILHIAAHDLKNPLQSILGFSELIGLEVEDDSVIAGWTKEIFSSSKRMIAFINAMLEEASLENGQIELSKKQIAIETIARKTVEQNQTQAERKEQKIHFDCEVGCFADVDKERLSEAFDNLIGNAIKYSEYGKQIYVSVKTRGKFIRFAVKDEGPGLTDEDKQKLFQKFQRLTAQPTGGESSTRLGLSITKLLVELHSGRIWAESEHGKGSTFFIELPSLFYLEEDETKDIVDMDKTLRRV